MEAPGFAEIVTKVAYDPPWVLAIAAVGWWYARALRVAAGRATRPHPRHATVAFYAGLATLAFAVLGPVEYWGNTLLWVNFLAFLLVTMIAAPLLVLGRPLTLAFRAGSPSRRATLRWLVRRSPLAWFVFPVVTWLTFAVVTYVWQFTGLTGAAAENAYLRDFQFVTLLAVSLLFWVPALAVDPFRWRLNHPLRVFYVALEMAHKGLFGGMFLSLNTPFHEDLAAALPEWAPSAMTDQRMAILVLWIGGNLIFLVALGYIIRGWLGYEARNNHRVDRRLALQRAAERERRRALDSVFQKSV